MHRIPRILVLAIAATLLVSSVAQAGKPTPPPPTTGAGEAWSTSSGSNPIPLLGPDGNGGEVPAVVATLTLPSDGKFVLNATVEVYNTDTAAEPIVSCHLRHGVLIGGTIVDQAETRLPTSNPNGIAETKLALTGAIVRTGASSDIKVFVVCSSNLPAGAQFGQLNATSVSSLTIQ